MINHSGSNVLDFPMGFPRVCCWKNNSGVDQVEKRIKENCVSSQYFAWRSNKILPIKFFTKRLTNYFRRPQPTEQGFNCGRACWEIWHKWSGRVVLLCGIVNITLGLFLAVAPSLVWILWLAYVGMWLVIFIVAEIVKRPFEKELRRRARKPMVYDTTNPYRINRGQANTAFWGTVSQKRQQCFSNNSNKHEKFSTRAGKCA